ncbi:hypothetical protein L1887_61442 [Cichorium endivia]|nr:hypothetical protein L1887_61442 [Cichorium endivia]
MCPALFCSFLHPSKRQRSSHLRTNQRPGLYSIFQNWLLSISLIDKRLYGSAQIVSSLIEIVSFVSVYRHRPSDPVPEKEECSHKRRPVHLLAVLLRFRCDQLLFDAVSHIRIERK